MKTRIHRSAWKVLRRILLITKMYCETLFIFWLMLDVLPPMPLLLSVAVVCALVLIIERVWHLAGLRFKGNYEIIDDQHYDERTVRRIERAAA
jgi:hypothetical protein